jgi:hypothetical protein
VACATRSRRCPRRSQRSQQPQRSERSERLPQHQRLLQQQGCL